MSHRFYLDTDKVNLSPERGLEQGAILTLDGDQAHHAINVMRFRLGDELVLFDGFGVEHVAKINEVKKKSLQVTIVETREVTRSLDSNITIAVALPKGDRQKFLVEKMVELGVASFVPLKTARSVAVPNDKVIGRLKKQVVEASKQCGRNVLMQIESPKTVSQLIAFVDPDVVCLLADPYCDQTIGTLGSPPKVLVAVGPEGGFDESETAELLNGNFKPTKIGPAILRIETACVAAASILGIGNQE